MAETSDRELAAGETLLRMPPPTGQPQMPFPGMPMMHMRPGVPGMPPPNFRGMMMPYVSLSLLLFLCCGFCLTNCFHTSTSLKTHLFPIIAS